MYTIYALKKEKNLIFFFKWLYSQLVIQRLGSEGSKFLFSGNHTWSWCHRQNETLLMTKSGRGEVGKG